MTTSYNALLLADIAGFVLVIAIFLASRVAFREKLYFQDHNSDSLFHRTVLKLIDKNGFFKTQEDLFFYPILFHGLYRKLYKVFGWRVLAYQPLLMDLLISIVFLFFIMQFTTLEPDWKLAALLACFVLNPGLTIQRSGPRIFSFNERTFAELVYACFLLFIVLATGEQQAVFLVLAWLSAVVLICSSKFGRQAVLLCPLLAGLLDQNGMFVLVPLAAFAGALCLFPLAVHRQFVAQYRHLKWYWYHLDKLWAGKRNSWQTFEAQKGWNKGRLKHYLFQRNALSAGALQNFVPLAAIFGSFFVEVSAEIDAIRSFYLAGVIVWVITSFRPFVIIGEAERYLNYHCILGYVVIGALLSRADSAPLAIALIGCAAWFAVQLVKATRAELRRVDKFSRSSEESGKSAAFDFLKEQDPGTTMTIGEKGLAEQLAYRTSAFPWFSSPEATRGCKAWPDLFLEYPHPKPCVIECLKTRYFLVNETVLHDKYDGLRSKLLADYVPVFTCKSHTVYRLRQDREDTAGVARALSG